MIISRRTSNSPPSFDITTRLVEWLTGLPTLLQLSISTPYTGSFDRDVHLLHLPYLNAITLIYLYTTNERLPQASVASILAAACTARILGDLLASDRMTLLPEETGWYAAIAALALMHVRPLHNLAVHAAEHISTLRTFLERLTPIWHSSGVLMKSLQRALEKTPQADGQDNTLAGPALVPTKLDDLCAEDGVAWPDFFPFATTHTNALVKTILIECQSTFPELWLATVPGGFDDFLDGLDMDGMEDVHPT